MGDTLKVSVILPVYNCGNGLYGVLDCLLNQTYQDFEIIAIDDCSTDNSLKILEKYANKDSRIKIFTNQVNIGLTKSLNKAIKKARGEYIVRQDGDDISAVDRIEKQIFFLETNPEYVFCGSDGLESRLNKRIIKYFKFNEIKRNLMAENCFIHPSMVIRKFVFENYGYYNENYLYGQDYELWCRYIYKYRLKGVNIRDILIYKKSTSIHTNKRNLTKFVIQRLNSIKTKLRYLNDCKYKGKGLFSIFLKILELITFSKLMVHFSPILEKIDF